MQSQVHLGDLVVDVVRKDIKNVHLSVHPPTGRVTIAAPLRMSLDTLRVFAISKLSWIRQQQRKLQDQERETAREFLNRESHYVWGRRYLLTVVEADEPTKVTLSHSKMVLRVRRGTDQAKRHAIIDGWYRELVKHAAPPLIAKWERMLGVKVQKFHVRRMKTKWGSCNPTTRTILLNTDLAKKPRECLEYLVVHEMVHLLEPSHNRRFILLMDRFLPKWSSFREALNRLPVRHEYWGY